MKRIYSILMVAVLGAVSANAQRMEMDISGRWNTELGVCRLPGTTDENRLGGGVHAKDVTSQLTRVYPFAGVVNYERKVLISEEMSKKHLSLYLERTKPSTLWIDGDSVGSIGQLYAPHVYQLPRLAAGEHSIKIRVDNRPEAVPGGVHGSHAWTDATQTNWNGIIGKMAIVGTDGTYINKMNVYPHQKEKVAYVKLQIISDKKLTAKLVYEYDSAPSQEMTVKLDEGKNDITYLVQLGEDVKLWSEFHPNLHNMKVTLKGKKCQDERSVRFGVRDFGTEGTQFTINGHKTFLRGTHDACVFPLYAYSPTDVNEWRKLFKKAKEYGINHYRFHSYTPTEAAFEAADELGIYLQTELPLWGTIDSTTVVQNEFLLNEARTAIDFLGNHPSFMSLGLGNELWGDFGVMRSWLDEFRKQDDRHMYVYGSNNTLGWRGCHDGEDYFVTCRVGGGNHYKTNTRTSFSFADEEDGGILNHVRPNTRDDFSYPVSICPRPIVAHETCQFQMYPDYDQIKKYTGVLYPYNLEIFRDRLNENGLTAQQKDFTKVTNRWGLECYKADIEYCVRTKGFGGYQLLDLKDYPGQGSALCGILDVFMDAKDSEYDKKVVNVMQPIVPLLQIDKFCWSTSEPFKFDISVANYSEDTTCDYVEMTFEIDGKKKEIAFNSYACPPGNTHKAIISEESAENGKIKEIQDLISSFSSGKKATITLKTGNHEGKETYRNEYNVWFYPEPSKTLCPHNKGAFIPKGIILSDTLDTKTLKALKKGKTVVLTPSFPSIEKQSIGGLFTPDYWNYAMFKTISENNKKPVSPGSLGMLMDAEHPLFEGFPTDGHTDWQWWCVAKNSRPLILNSLAKDYRPLIQTVDNVERNHKLGILMEFKVGKGKLLISTTDFDTISEFVEGRAYRQAILNYAASASFNPTEEISIEALNTLLYSETTIRNIQGVKNITDYKNE